MKVRPGLWKQVRKGVYRREEGMCQNCGLPVKESPDDPDYYPGTDRPTWTVHHKVSKRELRRQARMKCNHLSGEGYISAIRNVYTTLAIDSDNLELRCNRQECCQH